MIAAYKDRTPFSEKKGTYLSKMKRKTGDRQALRTAQCHASPFGGTGGDAPSGREGLVMLKTFGIVRGRLKRNSEKSRVPN